MATINIGKNCQIAPTAKINVVHSLDLGGDSFIGDNCIIEGYEIKIGRNFRMLPYAKIGGGGCFEVFGKLKIGHFCHLGMYSIINLARPVTIGNEVGLGTSTCIYTHGAYASILDGKPVKFALVEIGDKTWIPGAIINPGVKIGRDCVIAVGSVITKDLPDGSLAGGVPCKIIRENAYPRKLTQEEFDNFIREFLVILAQIASIYPKYKDGRLELPSTTLDLLNKTIQGEVTKDSERVLHLLRRYGIRFYYENIGGIYQKWNE